MRDVQAIRRIPDRARQAGVWSRTQASLNDIGRRSGSGAASDSPQGLRRSPYEKQRSKGPNTPQFVLIFDTETTPDETNGFASGLISFAKGKLREQGLFYDKVDAAELETLKAEAPKHGCVEPLEPFMILSTSVFCRRRSRREVSSSASTCPSIFRGSPFAMRRRGCRDRPGRRKRSRPARR